MNEAEHINGYYENILRSSNNEFNKFFRYFL